MKIKTKFKQTEIGMIPEDWEVVKIETVLDKIIDYRGKTPKKSTFGIKTLSARSIKKGRIDYNQTYFISEKTFEQWEKRGKPQKGDVLLTTEGPLGEVAQLDREGVAIAQRLLTLRGKEKQLDNSYLKYFLMSPIGQQVLLSRATGTTVQGIKQSEFRKIIIVKPFFQEQSAIAKILSDLDSKIELNQQMNKTLEAIGQAIFKHWFINFEFPNEKGKPYKSSGGEMVDSESGEIPKGWRIGTIQDIATQNKEQISPIKSPEEVFNHFSIEAYDSGKTPLGQMGSEILSNKFIVSNLSVLFCKLNPRIPRVWPVINAKEKSVCSTEFLVFKPNKSFFCYLHFLFKEDSVLGELVQMARGTSGSHQRISASDILDTPIIIPNKEVILNFDDMIFKIILKYEENIHSVNTLSQIRDSLLPKLMSGKIRVPVEA